MRLKTAFLGAFFALVPAAAMAAGLDLSWNRCPSESNYSDRDISLPCDTPGGSAVLHGSFISPLSVPALVAMEVTVDVYVDAPTLPGFWDFQTVLSRSSCNPGLTFSAVRPPSGCGGTAGLWSSVSPGNEADAVIGYVPSAGGAPNRGRLFGLEFRALSYPTAVTAEVETFAFAFELSTGSAVEGGGPCSGCSDTQLALRFVEARLYSGDAPYPIVINGPGSGSDCVTVNGGVIGCFTPTRRSTWGVLKSLYR